MDKKKYLIAIAVVVFAFLTIFTFANPFDKEEKELSGNVLEEIEEEDLEEKKEETEKETEKEETKPVIVVPQYPIYNNHGIIEKPQITVDNSYENALKAVEEIEKTFDAKEVEAVEELVSKVKDETKKEELEERLSAVKGIIELTDLVDTLVKDVIQSLNKEELDSVREFVVQNKLDEKIAELTNESVKKSLTDKMLRVASKLEDVVAPSVNIEDGAILNEDIKVIVTDDSEVIITLNEEEVENNITVSEGKYTLVAVDESFNMVEVNFIVDKTLPELTLENPESYELEALIPYEEKGYIATDDVSGDITELVEKTYKFSKAGTEEWIEVEDIDTSVLGTYEITYTVTDEAGNVTSASREVVIVDTVAPEASVEYSTGSTFVVVEDATNVEFTVYKEDELVYTYLEDKSLELNATEFEAGEYVVKVTDEAGNVTEVDVYVAKDLKSALEYTDEITLYEDLELNETLLIENGQDKVINLNGKKIVGKSTEAAASNLIKVSQGASLRLEGEGEISFTAGNPDTEWGEEGPKPYPGYANNTISNSGKLVIDGPTIINNTARGGASYVIDNYPGADLKILSGTITQAGGDQAIRLFANSATVPTKVTINGGTITGHRAIWIQLPSNNSAVAPLVDVTINGGTLTSIDETYNLAIYSYSYGNSFANTNVTINGGTFNGHVAFGGGYKGDKENVSVDGGTFNGSVFRYLADGVEYLN